MASRRYEAWGRRAAVVTTVPTARSHLQASPGARKPDLFVAPRGARQSCPFGLRLRRAIGGRMRARCESCTVGCFRDAGSTPSQRHTAWTGVNREEFPRLTRRLNSPPTTRRNGLHPTSVRPLQTEHVPLWSEGADQERAWHPSLETGHCSSFPLSSKRPRERQRLARVMHVPTRSRVTRGLMSDVSLSGLRIRNYRLSPEDVRICIMIQPLSIAFVVLSIEDMCHKYVRVAWVSGLAQAPVRHLGGRDISVDSLQFTPQGGTTASVLSHQPCKQGGTTSPGLVRDRHQAAPNTSPPLCSPSHLM